MPESAPASRVAQVLACVAFAATAGACGPPPAAPAPPGAPANPAAPANPGGGPKLEPQITYDVTTVPPIEHVTHGAGPALRKGDLVEMHYVGTLPDGKVFDSSRVRDEPFAFELGAGHVIEGWELVIAKLKVGDRVTTTIPSDLAYGDRGGAGGIQPRAALRYDIEVLRVVEPPKWEVLQKGDGAEVANGRTVLVHHVGTLANGTEYRNTRTAGVPTRFRAGVGEQIEGWDRVVVRMRVGDRWKITIPWVFAFGAAGRPSIQGAKIEGIPPKMDLVDDVEVLAVADLPALDFVKRGAGAAVARDSRVGVRFTGRLAAGGTGEGAVFDSSEQRGEPFTFTVGSMDVVDGWNEFFPYLRVGDHVRVRVPWMYGYGLDGHGQGDGGQPPKVPPRTDLVYDIEVLRVE